jgi:hypothetical protein
MYAGAQPKREARVHDCNVGRPSASMRTQLDWSACCMQRVSPPEVCMNLNLSLTPIVSLIAGALILIVPRLLNYIVAIYLIVIGLVGLFGSGTFHLR